jgi:hypothetical protein
MGARVLAVTAVRVGVAVSELGMTMLVLFLALCFFLGSLALLFLGLDAVGLGAQFG